MRPLTATRPKCMLPVANRPLLEFPIAVLASAGVRDVTIVVGYQAHVVRQRIGSGKALGIDVIYAEQAEALGTGDAVRAAAPFAGETIVANGDVILPHDAVERLLRAKGNAIAAVEVPDARPYGALRVSGGTLRGIEEKSPDPPSNLVNAGLYKLTPSALSHLDRIGRSPRGELELTSAVNAAVEAGEPVHVVRLQGPWMDLGRPWDLLSANERLLANLRDDRAQATIEPGVTIHGNVQIGKGTILRAGTYVQGPVVIGDECDIGPNCYLRASTVIGNRCRVGNGVEIKNSLLMDGTHVGHLSYVGDSVLGHDVNFGAGTITANLRHDGHTIAASHPDGRVDTGRRKFGCVCGDGVHTGIKTALNVGAVLQAGATTKPGEVVG